MIVGQNKFIQFKIKGKYFKKFYKHYSDGYSIYELNPEKYFYLDYYPKDNMREIFVNDVTLTLGDSEIEEEKLIKFYEILVELNEKK